MGVAHQHDGLVAAFPGEYLEAGLVVEVVGALALGDVAPAARHMAGGIDILQEMQGEGLVEQGRARQFRPLRRRQRSVVQAAGLLQCADVEPGVNPGGIEVRAGPQRQHPVFIGV